METLAIVPGKHVVVSAGSEDKLRLWDFDTGECLDAIEGHSHVTTKIAFTPDGRRLVSGSIDTTLRVWTIRCK